MSNWENYKKTMTLPVEDWFDFAREGQIQKISQFIESNSNFDLNQKNIKGYSALMLAAYNGNYDATKLLIELGADVNSVDYSNQSILMGIAFKGYSDLADLLLKHGANPYHQNVHGQTALDVAYMFGRSGVSLVLLSYMNSSETNQSQWIEMFRSWVKFFHSKTHFAKSK